MMPDETDVANLRPAMYRGALWMIGVNVVRRGLGIISTIILARLLAPDAFGLVAMAHVLITMFQVLTEFGFDIALIQKRDVTDEHYNTAWTFNVIFGLASSLLLVVLAVPAADFYGEPAITPITAALALGMAIRGFENIGIVNFRKHLDFHKEFKFYAIGKISAFIVTITVAVITRSYWALVVGTLTNRCATLGASYYLHDFRPRFSIARRRELFSFSIWMFLNNTLRFFRIRGADFIVGRMLGPFSLGLFTVSQEISNLPPEQVIAPINRAIFSGYAKLSHDRNRLAAAYINVIGVIALIAFPMTIGIAAVSKLAVPVLLGVQWLDAIPLVQLLAVVGLINSLNSNAGSTFIALGRPHIEVTLQAVSVAVLVPTAIFLVTRVGILGIVYSYLIASGLLLCLGWLVAMRILRFNPVRLLGVLVRPMISTVVMYLSVIAIQNTLPEDFPMILALAISVMTGAIVFTVMLMALWFMAGRPSSAETFILERTQRIPGWRMLATRLLRGIPAAS